MAAMRFIQLADVHLDSRLGGALNLDEEKKAVLRQDLRTALTRACDLAVHHGADVMLIPGDLFDHESLGPDTAAFLANTFEGISPVRVLIAPGNHDSLRLGNPYLPGQGRGWPGNVHIFTSPEVETVTLPELGCAVTGIAHTHRGITDRLLAQEVERGTAETSILLLHGSRDGYRPSDKESVIPFSDDELLAQGFTYTAIGHYHSFCRIEDAQRRVRGAYSGCLQGRGLDEAGVKYALLGEIDGDGRVTLEEIEVAPRRVVSATVDVTGAGDTAAVSERISAALARSGARECDIISVALCGCAPVGLRLDTSELESSHRYFHVRISESGVEPDYDLEALRAESAAESLKSAFARRVFDMQQQTTDPEERRALRHATYYGLYALDGRKLEPRDED